MTTEQQTTLDGKLARYIVRHADGSDIHDEFGARGQMTATRREAEELAQLHRQAGSDVRVDRLSDE